MPRLCSFHGIAIYMYFVDHNPPHFHAIAAEHEALIAIDDGRVLGGDLPKTAARHVEEWRLARKSELIDNWHRAQQPVALTPIDPLG